MPALSPLQLSPRASQQRRTAGALKSGSKAATIPEGALRGFATARSLVAADVDEELPEFDWGLAGGRNDDHDGERGRKRSGEGLGKAIAAAVDAGGDAEVPKPKNKPRARNMPKPTITRKRAPVPTTSCHFAPALESDPDPVLDPIETLDNSSKAKTTKPRTPRAKKAPAADGEKQTTIKKARITKPRASAKTSKAASTKVAKEKAADVVSAHFREATEEAAANDAAYVPNENSVWEVPLSPSDKRSSRAKQQANNQPLELEEAVSRRRDWTPTRDTEALHVLPDSAGKENDTAFAISQKGSFTSLLSGYAYAHMDLGSDVTTSKTSISEGTGVVKRRRVELVDLASNQVVSRQSSPEKGKAPKKKPRTITDLVTEQYAPRSANADVVAPVTSDFFSVRTTTATTIRVPLNDANNPTNIKASKKPARRGRSTSRSASEKEGAKGKPKLKKSSTKAAAKPTLIAEKLLSPASALLRLNAQSVLFGTSSQLALDESPTLVRQTQQAMLESEADADFQQTLGADVPVWPRLQNVRGKRSLWAASARDEDGATLERQAVYLPEPDRTQDFPLLIDGSMDEAPFASDISAPPSKPGPAPILISSDLPTPPPTISEQVTELQGTDEVDDTLFTELDNFPEEPPPSNQCVRSGLLDDDFAASAQLSPHSPQLHRPIAAPTLIAWGSPKKKRGRPPKLQSAIPQRVTASAPIPKKPSVKDKPSLNAFPRTPKKSQDRFGEIEEILDSEDDTALSPTPPRFRKFDDSPALQLTSKPPPPIAKDALVPIFRVPETHLQFAKVKSTLFTHITSLVRSLPPTTNPSKPSWHEKILMYDAIVLEDFTTFLNTHPTIRTYKKATQKQIKAWNKDLKTKGEEKMVIEEGDGMTMATEKEVEMWMVRVWCEEKSVCCVAREGKGSGGARKGLY